MAIKVYLRKLLSTSETLSTNQSFKGLKPLKQTWVIFINRYNFERIKLKFFCLQNISFTINHVEE